MTQIYLLLLVTLVIIGLILFYPAWRDRRIVRRSFPPHWLAIVQRRLPFFSRLRPQEQQQLKEMILLFLAKKRFYGCGGLQLNDDIRVTIAAEACLLLLNRRTSLYGKLQHILVYPFAFRAPHAHAREDGTVSEDSPGLLGESWDNGKVILSWDDVEHGVTDLSDGHNVVLHEFSHQLDSETGYSDGAPLLQKNSYRSWASVLSTEYAGLIHDLEHQHHTVMDAYGATNPAEFFAVATETFFEKPAQLAQRHPQLYQELKTYYCVDPVRWRY